ncbi:1277_t:CDS:2 [Acaulospora colombiana]|uniref:1277_t:CDS:1 n=1 Tax=Acaulospora colombiana TaxID=27376 RepID=A0ACA9KDG8_9GLOM|nr:1277_t:CDS:2 [Acaulospora colombiana]
MILPNANETVAANIGDKVGSGVLRDMTSFNFTEKDNNKVQSFTVPENTPKQLFYFDQNNCARGMYGVININTAVLSSSKSPSPTTSEKSTKSNSNSPTDPSLFNSSDAASSGSGISLIIVLVTVGIVLGLVLCIAGFMIYHRSTRQSGNGENYLSSMSPSHIEIIREDSIVRITSPIEPNRSRLLVPPSLANSGSTMTNIPRSSGMAWQSRPNSSLSYSLTTSLRGPSPTSTRRVSNLSWNGVSSSSSSFTQSVQRVNFTEDSRLEIDNSAQDAETTTENHGAEVVGESERNEGAEFDPEVMRRLTARETDFSN